MRLTMLHKFCRDEKGVTAIEYALIASALALVIVPALGDVNSGVLYMYGVIGGLFQFVL